MTNEGHKLFPNSSAQVDSNPERNLKRAQTQRLILMLAWTEDIVTFVKIGHVLDHAPFWP